MAIMTGGEGGLVGVQAGEVGQEAGMDVDYPPRPAWTNQGVKMRM